MTQQRKLVTETFLDTEGHCTAEELCALVKGRVSGIGQATVYRTLHLLVESGLADCVDFENGVARYEHAYGHKHHDHLVCVACGCTVEICDEQIERLQVALATRHGFSLTRHRMNLYGVCPHCGAESAQV